MSITVGEALSFCQEMSRELIGTEGERSPRAWLYLLRQALNEVAQQADGFYYIYETDLVSGQNLYCASPLYKIEGARALDAAGNPYPLGLASARDLAQQINPGLSATQSQGTPTLYATQGDNRVTLWPTPSYSTAGVAGPPPSGYGLQVEGYGRPGEIWIQAPGDMVSDIARVCPVSSPNAVAAAQYRAMELRALQFGKAAAAAWHEQFLTYAGWYEQEMATKSYALRRRGKEMTGGGRAQGPYPAGLGFDPLAG